MSNRAFQILGSIHTTDQPTPPQQQPSSPSSLTPLQRAKLFKPYTSKRHIASKSRSFSRRGVKTPNDDDISNNTTIQYFRNISKRRVKPSQASINDQSIRKLGDSSSAGATTHYRPFDRVMLLGRIGTFQRVINWDLGNGELTPLACALKGWRCDVKRQNVLVCGSCASRMAIKLPELQISSDDEMDQLENEMVEKIVEKYLVMLVEGHKENCPWRKQQTPMNVYEIVVERMDEVVESFKERYLHNLAMIWDVEDIEISKTLTDEETEVVEQWLRKHDLEVDEEAIELSVLGWSIEKQGEATILVSSSDARRVFVTDEKLNLLDEHHDWSCFVSGYKVLIHILDVLCRQTDVTHKQDLPQTPGEVDVLEEDDRELSGSTEDYGNTINRLNKMRELYLNGV